MAAVRVVECHVCVTCMVECHVCVTCMVELCVRVYGWWSAMCVHGGVVCAGGVSCVHTCVHM